VYTALCATRYKIVATLYHVSNWRSYYLFSTNFPIRLSAIRKARRLIAVLSVRRLRRRQDNFMAHEYHKRRRAEISRELKVVVNYAYGFANRISKIDTQIVCHSNIYKLRSTDSLSHIFLRLVMFYLILSPMLTIFESSVQRALMKTRRFSCCMHVYYTCERLARILANLPAGLEDLISFRTDRNTCNLITKKAFLIIHPTQLFLVTQKGRECVCERERERQRGKGERAFSIIRCNQPFLVMQKARLDYAS